MPFDIQARARLGGADSDDLQLFIPRLVIQEILDNWISESVLAGIFSADITVRGFQNSILVSENTVIGDLVESTFPGYALQILTAWTRGLDNNGQQVIFADRETPFFADGDPAGQTLGGLYLTNAAGNLLGSVTIDPALVLVDGMIVPVSITLQLGNS